MHSACDQVEEGTVLNSVHSYHAHPLISPTSATIELCKTWTINFPPPPGSSAYSPLPFGERAGVWGGKHILFTVFVAFPASGSGARATFWPPFLFFYIGERERHPILSIFYPIGLGLNSDF